MSSELTNKSVDIENINRFEDNKGRDIIDAKVEYDDLLSAAGEFGRYQFLMFLSSFPFYAFGVFVYYGQLFMTQVSPNHWCWISELENLTVEERISIAIPKDDNSRFGYSQCYSYSVDWKTVLDSGQKVDSSSWSVVPCQDGWEFNKTEIPYPTISSELGWVCERDSYQATAQGLFFVGSIFGGFLIGWVGDRFGRLPAVISSNIIGCIGGVLSTFATNFFLFAICRFFVGIAYDNCMIMAYLLVLEYVSPKYRTLFANLTFGMFYSITAMILPWIALACGHWKVFSLVISVPLGLAVLSPFFMPESPRWLLSKGRVDEAIEKVLNIGRINRKPIPPKLIEEFKKSNKEDNNEMQSYLEIFRRSLPRKIFILICLLYMICVTVFDGLVRTVGQIQFDFFTSFTLVSFTEFPSLVLVAFTMDIVGRRWMTTVTFLVCCIFSFLTAVAGSSVLSVVCAVIARFSVNMANNAVIQWAPELLPTSVRGSGVSFVHICGYLATITSSYIAYLDTYLPGSPLIILGVLSALGTLISIFLPETAKRDMPNTFDDVEKLHKDQKFWQLPKSVNKDKPKGVVNDCFEMS